MQTFKHFQAVQIPVYEHWRVGLKLEEAASLL